MTEDGGAYTQKDGLGGTNATKRSGHDGSDPAGVLGDDDDEPNIGGCSGYDSNSRQFNPDWRFYSAIGIFMVLTVLESINSTSTSTSLVLLGNKLEGSTSMQLEWIGNAYMLSASVMQLPIASLANIYGRMPLVMISFILFLLGSIICGAAPNIATILAGRSVQGIGGAGTLVLAEVCVSDLVPLRFRARYYGLLAVMWAIGSGLGPIIGGGFGAGSGSLWRWIFYFNSPICGLAILLTPIALRIKSTGTSRPIEGLKRIDWIGTVMFTGFSTTFILGLTLGGVSFGWYTWNTLVPLILGLLGMILTGFYEYYGTNKPMFAVNVLFANSSAGIAYLHAMAQGFMMESLPYYLPLSYQGLLGYSPILSGVALLPLSFVVLPSSTATGFLVTRLGHYKWISAIGWALLTLGLGLLVILSPDNNSVGVWLGPLFPTAIGLGILYSVLGTAVQAPQKPKHWKDAAAMMSFVRSLGEAMGVAVGGAVFASQMTSNTKGLSLPKGMNPSEGIDLVGEISSLSTDDPLKKQLQYALSDSMHTVYYVYIGISGLCFVLNLFMKEHSLDPHWGPEQYATVSYYDAGSTKSAQTRKGSAGTFDLERPEGKQRVAAQA